MDLNLKGKIAVVTGGNRGLGAASARMLAGEGARLFLTARDGDKLQSEAEAIARDCKTEVAVQAADLTAADACDDVVSAAMERYGRIDILVNAAGASQGGLFWEIPDQVWQDSFDLKFMATVRMMRAVIPHMRGQGYGRIVAIVGNTAMQPSPRMLPGAAANAALLTVVKGLADEVAGDGVIVNALNPGPTRTERWTNMMKSLAASSGRTVAEVEGDFRNNIPMDRLGAPEEIARLVTFLASDMAANMTGTSITADGGWTKSLA
jgi:NAD(P)-dependent dehydrogenase (short-subunit alcohol dehydrogenase family)